ncbi:MAG: GumC family protein [bacterium]
MEKEIKEVSFLGFIATILNWRRLILRNFLIFTILGLIISLILPHWYTSTATIMPPESSSDASLNMLSLISDVPFNLSGAFGFGSTMADIYIGILQSRNVREQVIKRLDLMTIWEEDLMEDALRQLDGQTQIELTDEGFIAISITARTRQRSQKMCQVFVEELDRVNQSARYTTARYTREFIGKRMKEADQDLRLAAEKLRDFQKQYSVISLEEQSLSSIRAAAEIRAQIALNEVEYDVLTKQLSKSHEKIKLVKHRIAALQNQLNLIEYGNGKADSDLLLPFSKIPDLGLQYIFLYKDVEVQKAIYELLVKQYEQARIQESRDTPTVEILDPPDLPERKSKPKRALVVLAASLLSFFISGFTIVINGYIEKIRVQNPEEYDRFVSAYSAFRGDAKRFFFFKRKQSP